MRRGYVANRDLDWFPSRRAIERRRDEVTFGGPGWGTSFRAVQPGEPIFFKLKAPHNAIAGFGFFAHFSLLPVSMAWDVYQEANGAPSFDQFRARLLRMRSRFEKGSDPRQDFWIGCILVHQPVFFDDRHWVRMPSDYAVSIVQGKTYDLTAGEGERIWFECLARAAKRPDWGGPS